MLARDGVELHAPKGKPAPTQLSITNPVKRLSSHSEESDTAIIVSWHEAGPGKVSTPRVLAVCRNASRHNFCWSIGGSPVLCFPCQETQSLIKYCPQMRAQPARIVLNVQKPVVSVLQHP